MSLLDYVNDPFASDCVAACRLALLLYPTLPKEAGLPPLPQLLASRDNDRKLGETLVRAFIFAGASEMQPILSALSEIFGAQSESRKANLAKRISQSESLCLHARRAQNPQQKHCSVAMRFQTRRQADRHIAGRTGTRSVPVIRNQLNRLVISLGVLLVCLCVLVCACVCLRVLLFRVSLMRRECGVCGLLLPERSEGHGGWPCTQPGGPARLQHHGETRDSTCEIF